MSSFDGRSYWNDRLTASWSLAGTGYQQYSGGYNRWLYRAKRRALRRALGPLVEHEAFSHLLAEVGRVLPYFRRLSRPTEASRLRFLSDAGRGALEFTADVVAPGQSWMHLAVLRAR